MKTAQQTGSRGRPDFLLLILTLALVGFGLVMVFSASSSIAVASEEFGYDALHFTKRQVVFAIIGTVAMLFCMNFRYTLYKKAFMLFFLPVLFSLIAVLIVGAELNGARSWFNIGGLGLQPTEAAKLAVILYLGALISKKGEKFRDFKKGLLPVIMIVGLILILIMMQPDLGSCLVLAAAAIIMIIAGGANLKQVFVVGAVALIAMTIVVSISMLVSSPDAWGYRINRITAFMDPLADEQGTGYHLVESLEALGHGGITGAGFGNGVQKLHYLPFPYNDFIFAVIAEEFGFIGSTLFLLFYLFFLWRGLIVALRCPDQYGTLVGVGIIGLIAIQTFVNIGGVINAIPVTGVTLPFISYGGSSLIIMMISMGILLSISRESNRTEQGTRPRR